MGSSVWPRSTTSTSIGGNTGKIIDPFELPPPDSPLRVRRAYKYLSEEEKAEFIKDMKLMKNLPGDDPCRFEHQLKTYYNYTVEASHSQAMFSKAIIAFHRMFLYMLERKLPNVKGILYFPSWNSTLESPFPDHDLYSSNLIDLDHYYKKPTSTSPVSEIIANNLAIMYRHIVSGAKTPKLFFGSPYCAGDGDHEAEPGRGTVQNLLHTFLHYLSSGPYQPDEDRGIFDTADRDAAFYAIHTTADYLWTTWESIHGQKRTEFTDPDLLDSSFVLYDENARLVRVNVRDCLDPLKLRYTYQEIPIPWLDSRPKPKVKSTGGVSSKSAAELPITTTIGTGDFPRTLDSAISVEVPRPRKSRSLKEKEDEEEVLLIRGIEVDTDAFVKFDVYVNDEDHSVTSPIHTEFAGSFTNSPYMHIQGMTEKNTKTCWRLGINETLEDLGAEDDDSLIVTIVPRAGTVAIGGVEIEFLSD